jgi:hypothetical protein
MERDMTDKDRRAAFEAAVRNCVYEEHPAGCSFGGMSIYSLYWLAAENCPLPHGNTCAWCGGEPTTGFPGWETGHEGDDDHRYLVPACEPCATEWVRIDPRWTKRHAERGGS